MARSVQDTPVLSFAHLLKIDVCLYVSVGEKTQESLKKAGAFLYGPGVSLPIVRCAAGSHGPHSACTRPSAWHARPVPQDPTRPTRFS